MSYMLGIGPVRISWGLVYLLSLVAVWYPYVRERWDSVDV